MSNALLAWDNALDDGAAVWYTNYGIGENLAKPSLSVRYTHPMSNGDAYFTCQPYGVPTVAAIALCSHNMSLAATVRILGYNASSVLVYDSGTLPAFASGVTAASRRGLRWNYVHKLTSVQTAVKTWAVLVSDATMTAAAEWLYIGRLLLARSVWQPTVNMSAGAAIGFESNSEAQTTLSGAEWFIDAEANRLARFKLAMNTDEMLTNAFDLARVSAGPSREVIFQYDPADGVHSVRRTIFGRLRSLAPLEEPQFGLGSTAFEVKELL
jgi:hypothetical protein